MKLSPAPTTKTPLRNISRKAKLFLPVLFLVLIIWPTTVFAEPEAPERSLNDHLTVFGTNFSPSEDEILNAKASGIVYLGPAEEKQGGFDRDGNLKKITTVVNLNINTGLKRAWDMIGGEYTGDDLNTKKHSYGLLEDQETFLAHIYQTEDDTQTGIIKNEAVVPLPSRTFVDDAWDEIGGEDKFKKDRTPLNRIVKIVRQAGASYNFGNAAEDGYSNGDGSAIYIIGIGTGYILGGKVGAVIGGFVTNLLNTSQPKLAGQQRALLYLDISSNANYKNCRICKTETLEKGKKTYMDIWYLGSARVSSEKSYPGAPTTAGTIAFYRAHSPYTQLIPAGFSYDYTGLPIAYDPNTGEFSTQIEDIVASKLKRAPFEITGDRMADFNFTYKEFPDENAKTRNLLKNALGKELKDIHYPYFKIGGTVEFTTPNSYENAAAAAAAAIEEANKVEPLLMSEQQTSILPVCNILPVGEGSVMGCVAQILYHGVFRPVAFFAMLMGKLFDFFLGYSLSDESYRHDFIQTGWQLVRDISNIFFILIMVWSGLVAVFNTSNVSYKKVVPTLIINALIINFSLFATRVVIDISNITARIFYNQMVVKIDGVVQDPSKSVTGYKPISESIVSSFNPQSIFDGMVLDKDEVPGSVTGSTNKTDQDTQTNVDFNSDQSNVVGDIKFTKESREYAGYFVLVTLVAIAISFGVAMMFWKTAFIFVGRVIGLYVAMIFSPFAFLSHGNIPLASKIEGINFGSWWGELFKYALLAPIFVFFLFILNSFLNVEFFTKVGLNQNGQGFFGSVMYVMIPMLIIYGLLNKAVGIAKKYSGEFGEMAQKFATNTTKIVGGVALGGAGLAARTSMSVASKTLGTWAAANKDKNIIASGANKFLQWGQKSSLDVRNTKAFGALGGLGIKTDDRFASALGIGQKDALKGNVGLRKERQEKKDKKDAARHDMSHLTDAQVKKVWGKMSDEKARTEAEKKWEEDRMKQLKDTRPDLRGLEDAFAGLSEKLETAIKSKNTTEEKSIREQIAKNTKDQQTILAPLVTTMLAEKKDNAHHETEEYKNKLKKTRGDIETNYGKVESAKELSAAMRYDYAKRMLEDSLLLSDGKKRSGMWALGGLLGGSGGALGNNILKQLALGISTGGASIIGGVLGANAMDDAQEAALSVNKKFVKDFEKAHNPEKNRAVKLKKQLEEIDDLINSHVDKALKDAKESLDGLDEESKEKKRKEYFDAARSNAQADTFTARDIYDDFRKKYAKEKEAMSETEREAGMKKVRDLADAYRKAKDESDALDNAHTKKEWTKAEIEKEEEKARNAEEKKREKENKKEHEAI